MKRTAYVIVNITQRKFLTGRQRYNARWTADFQTARLYHRIQDAKVSMPRILSSWKFPNKHKEDITVMPVEIEVQPPWKERHE